MKNKSRKSVVLFVGILAFISFGVLYFFSNYQMIAAAKLVKEISRTYWEWQTDLTPEEASDMFPEKTRLFLYKNKDFNSDGARGIKLFDDVEYVKPEIECYSSKKDCKVTNLELPQHYSNGVDKAFYDPGGNLYLSFRGMYHFEFYKNRELIVSVPTFYWTDGPIWNYGLVNGQLTFEYSNDRWESEEEWNKDGCSMASEKLDSCLNKAQELNEDLAESCVEELERHSECQDRYMKERKVFMDLYYAGKFMNEEYDMMSSK